MAKSKGGAASKAARTSAVATKKASAASVRRGGNAMHAVLQAGKHMGGVTSKAIRTSMKAQGKSEHQTRRAIHSMKVHLGIASGSYQG